MEDVPPLAEEGQERGGGQVEERRVVVEVVAVLDEPGRPGPGHVEVLLLVRVEAVVEEGDRPQPEGERGQRPEQDSFAFRQEELARPEGLEPPTSGSEDRCSIH